MNAKNADTVQNLLAKLTAMAGQKRRGTAFKCLVVQMLSNKKKPSRLYLNWMIGLFKSIPNIPQQTASLKFLKDKLNKVLTEL